MGTANVSAASGVFEIVGTPGGRAGTNQSSRGESKRESPVNNKQASFREAFFESGGESPGRKVEVDHICRSRDGRRRRENRPVLPLCSLQQVLTESLVQNRPEH